MRSHPYWRKLIDYALQPLLEIGVYLIVYLALRYLLFRLIDGLLERLVARQERFLGVEDRLGRLQTLSGLCKSVVGYALLFLFGAQSMTALGQNPWSFITAASVLGVVVGFGAQKLLKDVISGFFIIIDNFFVVGDVITVGAITGEVQEMGLRVTRLLDSSGKVCLLSNGDIGTVTNLSRHPVKDFIDISVAADANLDSVVKTINAAGEALFAGEDHSFKSAPQVQGVMAFNATSVTVRVTISADPGTLSAEQMRVRGAVRDALLAAKIALPP